MLRCVRPAVLRASRLLSRPVDALHHLKWQGWAPLCSQAHAVSLGTKCPETKTSPGGLRVRLDLNASQLIDEHREALRGVLSSVKSLPEATPRDLHLLQAEIARLGDGFFMLVVAGEYNAGKSSLINALIGLDVLPEGPTPTTGRVTKLRYADETLAPFEDEHGVVVQCHPVPVLASRLQIVDTPGTNAIDRTHEALTKDFLPLCDIVLFVTSADRPFSESERLFLESIRKWGKKIVLVVNKMDLLDSAEAKSEVMSFVSTSARALLGTESKLFALSARLAKEAMQNSSGASDSRRVESGFEQLEEYINDALDSIERLRLKLRSSASLGASLAEKYISVLSANKVILDKDRATVGDIQMLMQRHEDSVRKGYPGHFARVDNVLLEVLERAEVFLEAHVRISNLWRLSNRAFVEQTFEDEVVRGISRSLQREIRGVTDWLADLTSRNLTETTAVFSRRIGERAKEIGTLHHDGNIETSATSLAFPHIGPRRDFEVMGGRERLLTRLSESSDDLSGDYISRQEGKRFADKIANTVRVSAGFGIGSLACFSTFLVNSSSLSSTAFLGDPTFPLLAGALGAVGLVAIPRQRMAMRAELKSRMVTTRARLRNELRARLDEQLAAHMSGISTAVQPFAEFSERELRDVEERVAGIKNSLDAVRTLERKLVATRMHDSTEET